MKISIFLCLASFYCSLMLLSGCDAGASDAEKAGMQLAKGDRNTTFDCNKRKEDTCESGYEYCLRSTMALNRNWYKTSECVQKPTNCNSCDCAIEDAKRYFSMAKNCKGEIYCRYKNSQIVVTCVVPEGATNLDQEPSRNQVSKPQGNI